MSKAIYLYSQLSLSQLEILFESHQADFDLFLEETFTEEELLKVERQLDELAVSYVQPILEELRFEDLDPDPDHEEDQRKFFLNCHSSLCIENLPFIETNAFQVTYLKMLLLKFDEVLIDQGEVLSFKGDFVDFLSDFKSVDEFIPTPSVATLEVRTSAPVNPIDFLILDVNKELKRLEMEQKMNDLDQYISSQSEKLQGVYKAMREGNSDAYSALSKSGLNPKEFDDNLEKLKFILRKY